MATISTLHLTEKVIMFSIRCPSPFPSRYYIDSETDSKGKIPLTNYHRVVFIQHFSFPWRLLTQTLTLNQTNLSCFNILLFYFFNMYIKKKNQTSCSQTSWQFNILTKVIYKLCKWNIYLCEEFCGFF